MSSSVEQIKEKLSVEEVIGSYIKLERAGNNFKARCPFHNEKTPSFFVSPDRGSYYCFGCQAKGDIFTFVQEFESIDFIGALKLLADKAGITIEQFAPKIDDKRERIFSLLESTTLFLEKNLLAEEIPLEYLKKRGLKEKDIKDWRIGYVRDEWRSIYEYLKSKGYTDDEMLRAGMIKTEGQNTYDRFRGRIMFPIFDTAGRVIAFSGRILHDDGKSAKYLNSPQTEVFDKSKTLYGLDKAKHSIRKFDFSILVEGQMDIIMSHQAGFTNTVASSGTALTVEHLAILKRISNKIIMSFDSDNAGAKAAERSWALALSLGMDVKVAAIPSGFDPADLILKGLSRSGQNGKEDFKEVIKNSIHLVDFMLNRITSEFTDKKKLWLEIKKRVLPYIYLLQSETEKGKYVAKIADVVGTKEEYVMEDLKKVKLDEEFQIKSQEESKTIERDVSTDRLKKGSVERSLASIIASQDTVKDKTIIDQNNLREKIKNILGQENYNKFETELKDKQGELAFESEGYYGSLDNEKIKKEVEYLLLNLQEEYYKKEITNLLSDLKKAEGEKETERASSISIRLNEIMKRLSEIKREVKKNIN
jgi:DNA primase